MGKAVYGHKTGEKAFKELVESMEKSKFVPGGKTLSSQVHEEVDEADFAEDGSNLSEQDFNDAARDLTIANKIQAIVEKRQKKDPKFSLVKLQEEDTNRSKSAN